MATDLTTIFGTNIKVYSQPLNIDRPYVGLAGAQGVLSMHLGTRGRQIVVTGRLGASGANYTLARANLQAVIDSIETWLYPGVPAADFSFFGYTYPNCVFDQLRLIPAADGKVFQFTAENYAVCDFVAHIREQI